jgi:hypothetical protein
MLPPTTTMSSESQAPAFVHSLALSRDNSALAEFITRGILQ